MKIAFISVLFIFILASSVIFSFDTSEAIDSLNTLGSSTTALRLQEWQIAEDKNPATPITNIPALSWQSVKGLKETERYSTGNWLLKTNLYIPDTLRERDAIGIFAFNIITAYEIYWDGDLLAQNGTRGISRQEETAGLANFNVIVPNRHITPGIHTVLLRISNYNTGSPWRFLYGEVIVGKYKPVLSSLFTSGRTAFFMTGILLIAFLFNLFLFITRHRRTEHLLFSLFCLTVIFDYLVSQASFLLDLSTSYIHFEYWFYQVNTLLFTTLFPAFLIFSFSLPKRNILAIVSVILLVYIFVADMKNMFDVLSFSVLAIASVISGLALKLKREGSVVIAGGILLSWGAYFLGFAFAGLASVMVICSSFSIAHQFATKEKEEKEAKLKSTLLELELLKKNINPHFVLNTLTSIIVWLRRDSGAAIKLIEALAEEFRIINQVSALKQIPVNQEIDLCKAHLKIMGFRRGAEYKFETINIDGTETVPPMIFHTLVENGLTHGFEKKINGTFILQKTKLADSTEFILSNDGEFNTEDTKGSTGFGMRYVKSRLEESYPGKWSISSEQTDGGWETKIIIRGY